MERAEGFPRPVIEDEDMGIVLSDGCRLSARLWRPADALADRVPAVLECIPYRKRDGTVARDEILHPWLAARGYACLRVDLRGSGDSGGLLEDEYSAQELQDICEAVACAAAQPWCSGAVGLMGKSWGGFNALQVAALQPPALKAVVTVCSSTDRFADDIHFKGGCLLGENFGWGAAMLSCLSRPADPLLRPGWREEWLARLAADPWLAPRWAAEQARGPYWRHGSVCEDFSRLRVPVLAFGGWADNYMNTVAALVEQAAAQGVVGPWVHQYPHQGVPGPAIGFLQMALRWWDRWLKAIPNGAEADPAMRLFVQHSAPPDASAPQRAGHWAALPHWPPPAGQRLRLRLGPAGLEPAASEPDGAAPRLEPAARIATPQHLGLRAGEYFPTGLNAEMAGDQAPDDALSLCFDSAPLPAALDLIGAARLVLQLASDRALGFVVARLCDVAPDGSSTRLAHGMLNLCHRESRSAPTPLVPGQEVEVRFALDQMACRLAPGHRLRLALSNSYWPFVWPSPQPAVLTLAGGHLDLPLHPGPLAGWEPPPPEAGQVQSLLQRDPPRAARRIEEDLLSGRVSLVVEEDSGTAENLAHGLTSRERMEERWEIAPDDPLSACATVRWDYAASRGEWSVRTRATARMTATADDLRMEAHLTAWEGEAEVFSRAWDVRVPRLLV